ncbi:dihydrodipicolinate synthase family protein [Paratissierella segnis]|jgi:4-hydroxy-2-oxoglutarate aldolase|uniref:Dihydrodipicolinate synthase family protein n=1 Tax=Paratissierella segnis TaxID=2763679 RepID=A0A926EXA0_9FIRM|nr:dihydrodipicolinate synthase family protein [Paratissierella segnis]MBC8589281.1 dihydrodipicolinate synthase family protein [Paratissierella segnis]
MNEKLKGVFAPITTPFDEDGAFSVKKLEFNIQKYAITNIAGYLVLGSNGENKSLSSNEKEEVIKTVIANKSAGQVVMVGSIFESTRDTIEFALKSEELGADFITLLPPSYFKGIMTDSILIKYFTDVADAINTPCLMYNAPQFAGGVSISLNVIKQCSKHPNIVGIKDSSSGNIEKTILSIDSENFDVLSGSANTFLSALLHGATGGVISLADSLPNLVVKLYRYVMDGDIKKAVELNKKILRANYVISGEYGVAGVKTAMDIEGYCGGAPRLPLLPLEEEGVNKLRKILKDIELDKL